MVEFMRNDLDQLRALIATAKTAPLLLKGPSIERALDVAVTLLGKIIDHLEEKHGEDETR